MADIFFSFLFLVSLTCLIIGLIKPTIFSNLIKSGATRKKILIIFGIPFILFGVATDISKKNQKPATESTQNTQQTEINESNAGIKKIENIEERTSAINKVKMLADQDMLKRMGTLISFVDVYKNPKGEGVIVWMSSIAYPKYGYIYLILNDSVYAVSGDASILLPNIPKSQNLTFEDLIEISEMRASDYKMLFEACLKDVEILKENGLVEKRIKEAEDKCYSNYQK